MKVVTLGYHDVVEDAAALKNDQRVSPSHYGLDRLRFRDHLKAIQATGATVTVQPPQSGEQAVFLTFDDGALGSYTCAADELEKLSWRAFFFITSDWIGRPGFVDAAQIRDLRQRGHVVGSHTRTHPSRMSALAWEQLLHEWTHSCGVLSDLLGEKVIAASVSDGYYSRMVGKSAAAAGIQWLFNSEPTDNVASVDGCLIFGRFSVFAATPPESAAALVSGRAGARLRQQVSWNAKKVVKTVGGEHYLTLRKLLLSRTSPK